MFRIKDFKISCFSYSIPNFDHDRNYMTWYIDCKLNDNNDDNNTPKKWTEKINKTTSKF